MVPAAKPIVVSHHLDVEHVGHTKKKPRLLVQRAAFGCMA